MPLSRIPLRMFGVLVGSAMINDDGTIDLFMEANEHGIALMRQIESGAFNTLILLPAEVRVPAEVRE